MFFDGYGDGNHQEAAVGDAEALHSVQGALSALSQSVQAVYASLPENWTELEIRCTWGLLQQETLVYCFPRF